jgi:hypothetical protein
MLAAAGLARTWLYKKARVLAIFDDLDTVLLMIPLKMMFVGFDSRLLMLIVAVFLFLAAAYFCIHWLRVPTSNGWILIYALVVWVVTFAFDYVTDMHLEVLVPAFALGCVIKSDHLHGSAEYGPGGEKHDAHEPLWQSVLDWSIKAGFMLLAGMAMPPLQIASMGIAAGLTHVILLTILINLGKCLPLAAYTSEASIRERLALSVGMFPRGEVGIGVLLVSLEMFRYENILESPSVQHSMTLSALSLALNLALTGVFIIMVIRLLNRPTRE